MPRTHRAGTHAWRPPRALGTRAAALALALGLGLGAVGTVAVAQSPSPSAVPVPTASAPGASPGGSASPAASPSASPSPSPGPSLSPGLTPWPRSVLEAATTLESLLPSIDMGADQLEIAVALQDLRLILGEVDSLATVTADSLGALATLSAFPPTTAAADAWRPIVEAVAAAAEAVGATLRSGDLDGFASARDALQGARRAWVAQSPAVADLARTARRMAEDAPA